MKEYKCNDCINKNTPLCDVCYQTSSPGEDAGKPTYYQCYSPSTIVSEELDNLMIYINTRVASGVPVSINTIIKYNQLISGGT